MDVGRKVCFTYVMNSMGEGVLGNSRTIEYVTKTWEILAQAENKPPTDGSELPVV